MSQRNTGFFFLLCHAFLVSISTFLCAKHLCTHAWKDNPCNECCFFGSVFFREAASRERLHTHPISFWVDPSSSLPARVWHELTSNLQSCAFSVFWTDSRNLSFEDFYFLLQESETCCLCTFQTESLSKMLQQKRTANFWFRFALSSEKSKRRSLLTFPRVLESKLRCLQNRRSTGLHFCFEKDTDK